MNQFPAPVAMPIPMSGLQFARSYVLDQPYACVVQPPEALRMGTIFPFLLETYAKSLKKAEQGDEVWKS